MLTDKGEKEKGNGEQGQDEEEEDAGTVAGVRHTDKDIDQLLQHVATGLDPGHTHEDID